MVPKVRVVTDSTADIPADLAAALHIKVIPANIQFGKESFLDGVSLSRGEFYQRLVRGPVLPTTAAPAPGVFAAAYQGLLKQAREEGQVLAGIISIHVSSRLSGLYNAARLGAEELPGLPIRLVDSQQISIGTGWLAILAGRAAQAGQSLEAIVSMLEDRVPRLRLIAVVDTLEYVRRSGRLGKAQWLVGTLLNVKPIIEVRYGELLPPLELVRTRSRATDRLVEIAARLCPFEEMAVMHAHAPELGQALLARVTSLHPPEHTLFAEVGVTIGTYAGPGAVGIIGIQA